LKLFADAQVFVVALVGLVLRKDSETLSQEGQYDREFYGNVMLVLLVATLVPALATLAYKSPVERALVSLQEIASALPDPPAAVSASAPPTQPQSQPTAGGSSSTSSDPSGAGSCNVTISAGDQVHDDNCADLEAPRATEAEEGSAPQEGVPPGSTSRESKDVGAGSSA
jgi:hypothetical protein